MRDAVLQKVAFSLRPAVSPICTKFLKSAHRFERRSTSRCARMLPYTAAVLNALTGATDDFHVLGAFAAKVAEMHLLNIEPSPSISVEEIKN